MQLVHNETHVSCVHTKSNQPIMKAMYRSVIYICGKGTFGFVWFFAWMYFAHDTPRNHPKISPKELEYIETAVGEEQDHVTPKGQV